MLVLSRKSGQSLVIGEDVQVRVISVSGKRVKIGIEAPDGCRILRAELVREPSDEPEGARRFGKPEVETVGA